MRSSLRPTLPRLLARIPQAIKANGFVFASGQVALDPSSGNLVEGDVRRQTERALKNLQAVLEAAGSGLDRAVKTTVFLKNMADFAAMNEAYSSFFSSTPPARATVEVAGLPKGGLVEIELVALA